MSQVFRLFEPIPFMENAVVTFTGDSHHILSRVLRMKSGDTVELLNGCGQVAFTRLTEVSTKSVLASIESVKEFEPLLPAIRLFIGCLKGEKLSWVVQKIAELGVSEVGFFLSDHSVAMKSEAVLEKTRKTLIEAIRQSGNPFLPTATFFKKLEDIETGGGVEDWNIVLDETGTIFFPELLKDAKPKIASLFVGPEGGFSARERDLFKKRNFRFIRIAPYVLRADTAAVSAVSLFRSVFI